MTYTENIRDFARLQGTDTKSNGSEIFFKVCPYCHGGNHADKYTFSINVNTGQFNCKRASCNKSGNLNDLAKDKGFIVPENYNRNNGTQIRTKKDFIVPDQKLKPSTQSAYEYFEKRGISKKTIDKYKITSRDNEPRDIAIPHIDSKGRVAFIKLRHIDNEKRGLSKESYPKKEGKDKDKEYRQILFGMYQCDTTKDTLIITEGQIDCLSVAECGFNNVVSVPNGSNGFTWFDNCKEWLSQFKKLLVFGDCEKGHITLIEEIKKRFNGVILNVKPEYYKGCKDPNEILTRYGKDTLINAIRHSQVSFLHDCIIRLSDIKPEEYNPDNYIKTDIKALDKLLGGGFCKGDLVCLTGKSGEGKTTFASQIIANMINNNKKVLAYSGEIKSKTFQKWLNFQLASRKNIVVNRDGITNKNYIKKPIEKRIMNWYSENMFLLDNEKNDLKDNPEDLIEIVKTGIDQCDIDFVLIDNLMTAMSESIEKDLFTEQSKFVKQLRKLALIKNVVIMLVAHPRKSTVNSNDDIMGSGNIANLSAIILHYGKPNKNDFDNHEHKKHLNSEHRLLTVSKNRNNGNTTERNESIVMGFESESKRIEELKLMYNKYTREYFFDQNGMFLKQYNWESEGQNERV